MIILVGCGSNEKKSNIYEDDYIKIEPKYEEEKVFVEKTGKTVESKDIYFYIENKTDDILAVKFSFSIVDTAKGQRKSDRSARYVIDGFESIRPGETIKKGALYSTYKKDKIEYEVTYSDVVCEVVPETEYLAAKEKHEDYLNENETSSSNKKKDDDFNYDESLMNAIKEEHGESEVSNVSDKEKREAWICAQNAVEAELKAPKSADFCSISDVVVIKNNSTNIYSIKGWVDAQNSLGATVRQNFTVNLKLTSSGYSDASVLFY